MHIALIRRRFTATGGAELYLQRLARALVGAGHRVTVLAEAWDEVPVGVEFHAVPVSGTRSQRPLLFAQAAERITRAGSWDCVFSLERTLHQDVVRAGDGVHATWLEQRRRYAPWWKRPFIGIGGFHHNLLELERQTFTPERSPLVIVNSTAVGCDLMRRFNYPADRLIEIRNGVETSRFTRDNPVDFDAFRAAARTRFGLAPSTFTLAFVGSGWERKGLGFVLAILPRLASGDVRLLVAGKGRPPWRVHPAVTFLGPVRDVEAVYAAADLLVFPPIYEPASNVVFEARASGLPVVTSRWNGAWEILQPGSTGTVVEDPADSWHLLNAVREWITRLRPDPALPPRRVPPMDEELLGLDLERNVHQTVQVLERVAR